MTFKQLPREHGTDRGYQQHRARNDMPACEPCKAAHVIVSVANKRRRQKGKRCVECGEEVAPGRQKYCSEKCNRLGANRRERVRDRRRRAPGYVPQETPRWEPDEPERPRMKWVRRGLIYVAQRERVAS